MLHQLFAAPAPNGIESWLTDKTAFITGWAPKLVLALGLILCVILFVRTRGNLGKTLFLIIGLALLLYAIANVTSLQNWVGSEFNFSAPAPGHIPADAVTAGAVVSSIAGG